MTGLRTIAYNTQPALGHTPSKLAVILNQPAHHYALSRLPAIADDMALTLAALDADGQGLRLNIVTVRRP